MCTLASPGRGYNGFVNAWLPLFLLCLYSVISACTMLESQCPWKDEWKGFRLLTDRYGSHCYPLLTQDNIGNNAW